MLISSEAVPLMTSAASLMTWAAALMSLHVQRQVVRSGEGSVAQMTLEGFGSRVLPVVTGQLIRPGNSKSHH